MDLVLPTGVRLCVDQHGDPAAPTLLFLHGLSSSRTSWHRVVAHLEAAIAAGTLRVINVDLRGHGDSASGGSVEDYRADCYAADIAAVIEELGAAPAMVVGHSLGGVVAMSLATGRPDLVRAVLLEDPPLFEGDDELRNASPVASFFPPFIAAVRAHQARQAPWEDYLELLPPDAADPVDRPLRAQGYLHWDPTTMQAAVDGVVWHGFDPEAALAVPLTVVAADPACGAVCRPVDIDRVVAKNPGAHVATVAGAAHGVHSPETLQPFLVELDAFLARARG